ncbi:MAG: tetratricopeptide repeat protein [Saprospiraceae bacterium]|nr:tetratricopeptide repeat protein [Bacteroidia bacterium]NNE14769.1 tetratricopeptide repeat protein [Saprospiraceae bacterium]NNL93198.1 tetratricopeptide repeat protein [Saprospiraceae bacterium]
MTKKKSRRHKDNKKTSPQDVRIESKSSFNLKNYLSIIVLLLVTFLAFSPSMKNGFVNWDDDIFIYKNDLVINANADNFWTNTKEIFTSDTEGTYIPLTLLSFNIEKMLFGFDKLEYWHLNNILLHLICVLLVYLIGKRLKLGLFGSLVLAGLFALHPLRVESVTWLTERKDVLFGVFYLAGMLSYIKGKQEGFNYKSIVLVAFFFALSLFSKIQAVIFPVSLLLIDIYLSDDHRLKVKDIVVKLPLFVGSLIIGLINMHFLSENSTFSDQPFEGLDRLFIGAYSCCIYYIKSILPYKMSPLYVYPNTLSVWHYVALIPFLGTGLLLLWAYFKKWRVMFFGLAFFIANVILLLQILGAGQGYLADRFTYIPYFGLFFIFAYFLNKAVQNYKEKKVIIYGLVVIVLLSYTFLTFKQTKVWKNGEVLWTYVIGHYENSTLAWRNRANYYRDNNNIDAAIADYTKLIKLNPNSTKTYTAISKMYYNFTNKDSIRKGLEYDLMAVKLKPNDVEFKVNAASTYLKLNEHNQALSLLSDAEKIDPNYADVYRNRAATYIAMNKNNRALDDINRYLEMKSNVPIMWYHKSRIHNLFAQYDEALKAANTSIRLSKDPYHFYERAISNYHLGNLDEAKSDIREAQKLGFKGKSKIIDLILK